MRFFSTLLILLTACGVPIQNYHHPQLAQQMLEADSTECETHSERALEIATSKGDAAQGALAAYAVKHFGDAMDDALFWSKWENLFVYPANQSWARGQRNMALAQAGVTVTAVIIAASIAAARRSQFQADVVQRCMMSRGYEIMVPDPTEVADLEDYEG